ncbi:MAG TPA: neutral/alkaline non-lysosomal ceramidase N-terminal domain-containing protein, partial [Planctomycetota bacterium]|nr:neutral/alkaline non-lysosomal ceramidase N-terminal domain-containing protein [Planctomycetota bacterium]
MGGFGMAGQLAAGVWHRLYARAIYLRDPKGTELVLVSCDLPFFPGALGNKVAELVGRQSPSLSREQLLFCATHTPHGPGNFSTSAITNTLGSPRPGYDPVLFEFLVNRLAKAVLAAQSSAEAAQLSYAEAPLGGISMNRSLRAFLQNPESQDILKENESLDLGGPVPCPPLEAYHAVDPTLAVIRAVRAQDPKHTIALLGFFAVHPSSLGPPLPLYDSDLFGVASTLIEQELARSQGVGDDGVAAFINGAEGDLVTTAPRQDREDLEALGGKLAQGVLALAGSPAPRPLLGNLAYSCASYEFPNPPEPLIGAAALGGTEDGRTMLYDLGWREYLRSGPRQAVAGQGTKRDPLDSLQFPAPTLGRAEQIQQVLPSLPDHAWIGVYRIGSDLMLATLPGEFTTTMGRRIRRALEGLPAAGAPRPKVLLVGMANEDAGTFTTPEEHDVQAASGASMAYGREAAASILGFLTQRANPPASEVPRKDPLKFSYTPGPATYFGIQTIRLGDGEALLSGVPRESFVYR